MKTWSPYNIYIYIVSFFNYSINIIYDIEVKISHIIFIEYLKNEKINMPKDRKFKINK